LIDAFACAQGVKKRKEKSFKKKSIPIPQKGVGEPPSARGGGGTG
jgi:hypothetical protein